MSQERDKGQLTKVSLLACYGREKALCLLLACVWPLHGEVRVEDSLRRGKRVQSSLLHMVSFSHCTGGNAAQFNFAFKIWRRRRKDAGSARLEWRKDKAPEAAGAMAAPFMVHIA